MPSLIEARGFPVPEDSDQDLAKRPEFVSEAMAAYLTRREEPGKRHRRLLAKGINHVAMGAFSPKTYVKAGVSDVVIAGTTTGTATQIPELTHTIVSPIPATLWWHLTGRLTETGGVASVVAIEVRINGTIYRPRLVGTVAANTSLCISGSGPYDSTSADGAFWVNPKTLYTVDVYAFKVTAGATITVETNPQVDWAMIVRVEPRLL